VLQGAQLNILVTGCAGFIGSHAVDLFLSMGYSVTGVDCLTYAGSIKNIEKAISHKNFRWYKNDICDTKSVIDHCLKHEVEWIINFAAETHVDNSIESCERFIHSNIVGVQSLLECCRRLNISLFHVSTDEVYGSILEGSFCETSKLNPKNPYSATKAAAEHLITAYSNTYGVNYIIVRPSNNFGPRQHVEKLLPTVLRSLRAGEKIPVYGDGKNIRDWLYVKNNVKMMEIILRKSDVNQVYNITNGNEFENIEIIRKIIDILKIDFESSVKFTKDRLGHDFRYSISDRKIKGLNFQVNSNFNDDLKETIRG